MIAFKLPYKPSLAQFTVLSLTCLSYWLKSPVVAVAVVLTLLVKEGREYLDGKKKAIELIQLETKVAQCDEKVSRLQNEINRIVVRQSQYFGE